MLAQNARNHFTHSSAYLLHCWSYVWLSKTLYYALFSTKSQPYRCPVCAHHRSQLRHKQLHNYFCNSWYNSWLESIFSYNSNMWARHSEVCACKKYIFPNFLHLFAIFFCTVNIIWEVLTGRRKRCDAGGWGENVLFMIWKWSKEWDVNRMKLLLPLVQKDMEL